MEVYDRQTKVGNQTFHGAKAQTQARNILHTWILPDANMITQVDLIMQTSQENARMKLGPRGTTETMLK